MEEDFFKISEDLSTNERLESNFDLLTLKILKEVAEAQEGSVNLEKRK